MARGGRRDGVRGTKYPNRSDLAEHTKPLPAVAAKDQQYGKAGEQIAGQRIVPMAPPPGVAAGAPSTAGSPSRVLPGSQGPFDRPSERPDEPLTTGVPVGAGAGPEVLGLPPGPSPTATLVGSLEAMARATGSRDIAQLAMRAQQIKDA